MNSLTEINNKDGVGVSESIRILGKIIRERRLEMGYRQVDVAKKLKILQSTVSSIELGNRSLTYYQSFNWRKMAKVLRCDYKELKKILPKIPQKSPKKGLGWFVRKRRKELKMTLKEFAEKMNYPVFRVNNLEKFKRKVVKHEILRRIAEALQVDTAELSKYSMKCRRECTNSLGLIIQKQRKKLCLSGNELAAQLGVKRQYVNQIEGGLINMKKSDSMLEKIADILSLDFEELKANRPQSEIKKK